MELYQLTILALVQGITEFLPISSSGHLVIASKVLAWPDQGLLLMSLCILERSALF